MPDSGFDSGTLTGVRTRNRAVVKKLQWDTSTKKVTAEITSDIDQTLNVSYGKAKKALTFKAGETKTIEF